MHKHADVYIFSGAQATTENPWRNQIKNLTTWNFSHKPPQLVIQASQCASSSDGESEVSSVKKSHFSFPNSDSEMEY